MCVDFHRLLADFHGLIARLHDFFFLAPDLALLCSDRPLSFVSGVGDLIPTVSVWDASPPLGALAGQACPLASALPGPRPKRTKSRQNRCPFGSPRWSHPQETGRATMGGIVRDHNGAVICSMSENLHYCFDAEEAEAMAL